MTVVRFIFREGSDAAVLVLANCLWRKWVAMLCSFLQLVFGEDNCAAIFVFAKYLERRQWSCYIRFCDLSLAKALVLLYSFCELSLETVVVMLCSFCELSLEQAVVLLYSFLRIILGEGSGAAIFVVAYCLWRRQWCCYIFLRFVFGEDGGDAMFVFANYLYRRQCCCYIRFCELSLGEMVVMLCLCYELSLEKAAADMFVL